MYRVCCVWAISLSLLISSAQAADSLSPWPAVALPAAGKVELSGPLGEALAHGVARLAAPPYSEAWLRADVSFEVNRIFTNYSGDVSGRFLELAALTSPAESSGKKLASPATLAPLMKTIIRYQKPDGHFGVDVDLAKPLVKTSPPITLLWGNARLLVGLVTASQEFHDPALLAAARRLGDFYVHSADRLCSPSREADYRSSGTYGEGYVCCYFPAIEGLCMLYRATRDDRYLQQAQRMAEFFTRFDALPIDHSHGNLCTWRGILLLYEITGQARYLDRAKAKWDAAMQGGYVWALGGIGEHWYVFFPGDEGCSESDWLRFSLDLWRFTGRTRYLDVAERLVANQYAANQCANGGFGMCKLDGGQSGPNALTGELQEWPFCCSFHGPLGLHFLKSYLVAGCDQGILVNLFEDCTARVNVGPRQWLVKVHREPDADQSTIKVKIDASCPDDKHAATVLWIRSPSWQSGIEIHGAGVQENRGDSPSRGEYDAIPVGGGANQVVEITFHRKLTAEGRRFQPQPIQRDKITRLRDVALVYGPDVLFAAPAGSSGRPVLLATIDGQGQLGFPRKADGGFVTIALPSADIAAGEIAQAARSGRPVVLRPWSATHSYAHDTATTDSALAMTDFARQARGRRHRAAFMVDLVVAPAETVDLAELGKRLDSSPDLLAAAPPRYGENLERRPDYWLSNPHWKFGPQGLLVSGGDIGLLDGEGYGDYRLEFDLTLPKEGRGIAGWIVRAQDEENCLMFQVQSSDSTFREARYKTRPNTLRPHVRRGGQWEIADPVPFPKTVLRGETHHVAVECRQAVVRVFFDGERVYENTQVAFRGGTIGIRAADPGEQGLFRKISLTKL